MWIPFFSWELFFVLRYLVYLACLIWCYQYIKTNKPNQRKTRQMSSLLCSSSSIQLSKPNTNTSIYRGSQEHKTKHQTINNSFSVADIKSCLINNNVWCSKWSISPVGRTATIHLMMVISWRLWHSPVAARNAGMQWLGFVCLLRPNIYFITKFG